MTLSYRALCKLCGKYLSTSNTRLWVIFRLASEREPGGGPSVTRLAQESGLSAPAMHGVLDRMLSEGVVERQTDDGDQRRRQWRLTQKGLAEARKRRRQAQTAIVPEDEGLLAG